MKGFDRLHIKSAVKSRNRLDLSQDHLTTLEIGEIVPLYWKPVIPGDKFNVEGRYFARLSPLVKPTYGRFSFRTISCFVPFFQVADEADAYLNNQTTFEGSVPNLRFITMADYVAFLISIGTAVTLASGESDGNNGYIVDSQGNRVKSYDFKYYDANGSKKFLRFLGGSKYLVKVCNALGFSLPSDADLSSIGSWYTYYSNFNLNITGLLCFVKAYNDWMSQSSRYNTSTTTYYLRCIRHNVSVANIYDASTFRVTPGGFRHLVNVARACYESDYFTTAWQQPNAILSGNETNSPMEAPSANVDGSEGTIVNNQYNVSGTIQSNQLSDLMIRWIESVANYVRRNNYSGSRTPEKMLSRFGIKSEDFKSNYAHLIDKSITQINIGDVTAQAQTNDNNPDKAVSLGDYAGKGIISGGNSFSFDSKDHGLLVVLGWLSVSPMNAYGFDRFVLSNSPNDFYQPEFDGVGPEAISNMEVFTNPIKPDLDRTPDNGVFGFTERYNSYRFGRDFITGDFRNLHEDADMNVWHTGRLLNQIRLAQQMVAQSTAFNTITEADEYNRIFADVDSEFDHFMFSCQFIVKAIRPMLSLNQVPRLGVGDTNVSRNGNEIN